MTYRLIQLAPGAYDPLLHDTIVASVVRNGSRQPYTWRAELLETCHRENDPFPSERLSTVFHPWTSYVPGLVTRR